MSPSAVRNKSKFWTRWSNERFATWHTIRRARHSGAVAAAGKLLPAVFPTALAPLRQTAVAIAGPEKEEFAENAFEYRVNAPDEEIHFLSGHRYDKPLASKLNGTLKLRDTSKALEFEARILPEIADTSHGRDALALLSAGLAVGISPGFRLPPERAVPREEAETFEDEPINPDAGQHGARIRIIRQALLYELSLVTRPAFPDASAESRTWAPENHSTSPLPNFLKRWRY